MMSVGVYTLQVDSSAVLIRIPQALCMPSETFSSLQFH